MAFIYRTENSGALTPSQEKLLENIETLPSPYDGISMLADLRRRTGLSVVVSDRGSLIKRLKEDIDTISNQIDAYQKDANRQKIMNQIERDIYDRRRWAQSKLQEVGNPDVTPLLGLYSRKLLWFERLAPTVYLYSDNINDYASRIGKNPDHVFGYVFDALLVDIDCQNLFSPRIKLFRHRAAESADSEYGELFSVRNVVHKSSPQPIIILLSGYLMLSLFAPITV